MPMLWNGAQDASMQMYIHRILLERRNEKVISF